MDRKGDLRDYNLVRLHYWGVGLCVQWSAHNGDFVNYLSVGTSYSNMFPARPFPPQILDFKITFRLIKTIYRSSAINSYASDFKKIKTVVHSETAINKLYHGRVTEEKHEN
jgi:hypothetical protein